MKKTYWWRILVLVISFGGVFLGWVYDKYFCFSKVRQECLLDQYRLVVFKPIIFF